MMWVMSRLRPGQNHHCKVSVTELHFRKFSVRYEPYRSLQVCVFVEGETMKFLLLLLFLLFSAPLYAQTNAPDDQKTPVVVVSASWMRERQSGDKAVQSAVGPAP